MIESVTQFVNENYSSLIKVIVVVLFIFFFYWWFCCKGRHLGNKVKGGEVSLRKVPYGETYYNCLGMKVVGKYNFIVLSKKGENLFEDDLVYKKFSLFYHLLITDIGCEDKKEKEGGEENEEEDENEGGENEGDFEGLISKNSLAKIIKYPIYFINDESLRNARTLRPTFLKMFDRARWNNDLYEYLYESYSRNNILYKYGDQRNTKTVFNTDIIENDKKVVEYYALLLRFLTELGLLEYFDFATYIGQPSKYALARDVNNGEDGGEVIETEEGDDSGEEEEEEEWFEEEEDVAAPEEGICDGEAYRWSINKKGVLRGEINDVSKSVVRYWYNGTTGEHIVKQYITNENGEIKPSASRVNKKEFQVADIYPAYKLTMVIYLLLTLFPKFDEIHSSTEPDILVRKTTFLKMIASYIVLVQLFNTFCAARMEKKWNINIGNKFVYFYINNNGQVPPSNILEEMLENEGNLFGELTGRFIMNHIVERDYVNDCLDGMIREGTENNKISEVDVCRMVKVHLKSKNTGTLEGQEKEIYDNVKQLLKISDDCESSAKKYLSDDRYLRNYIHRIKRHEIWAMMSIYEVVVRGGSVDANEMARIAEKINNNLARVTDLGQMVNAYVEEVIKREKKKGYNVDESGRRRMKRNWSKEELEVLHEAIKEKKSRTEVMPYLIKALPYKKRRAIRERYEIEERLIYPPNVWTEDEIAILKDKYNMHNGNFKRIAHYLKGKTPEDCRRKYKMLLTDEMKIKGNEWKSLEESFAKKHDDEQIDMLDDESTTSMSNVTSEDPEKKYYVKNLIYNTEEVPFVKERFGIGKLDLYAPDGSSISIPVDSATLSINGLKIHIESNNVFFPNKDLERNEVASIIVHDRDGNAYRKIFLK